MESHAFKRSFSLCQTLSLSLSHSLLSVARTIRIFANHMSASYFLVAQHFQPLCFCMALWLQHMETTGQNKLPLAEDGTRLKSHVLYAAVKLVAAGGRFLIFFFSFLLPFLWSRIAAIMENAIRFKASMHFSKMKRKQGEIRNSIKASQPSKALFTKWQKLISLHIITSLPHSAFLFLSFPSEVKEVETLET